MNVLEKILEEIEHEAMTNKEIGRKQCEGMARAMNIIRSHMNDVTDANDGSNDWIPVEERLPEEHDSIFAKFKGTNKWGNAMFEKRSDEVNVTYKLEDGTRKTGTSYTLDGKWKIEKENGAIKRKIVAWRPLPEPYKAD